MDPVLTMTYDRTGKVVCLEVSDETRWLLINGGQIHAMRWLDRPETSDHLMVCVDDERRIWQPVGLATMVGY